MTLTLRGVAEALTGWSVVWAGLPGHMLALTCWQCRTITVDPRQGWRAARSSLVHEARHVARGPAPDDPDVIAWEEQVVEMEAARLLIPMARLLRAVQAHYGVHDKVAEALRVDRPMLDARLRGLHPSEFGRLHRLRQAHGATLAAARIET